MTTIQNSDTIDITHIAYNKAQNVFSTVDCSNIGEDFAKLSGVLWINKPPIQGMKLIAVRENYISTGFVKAYKLHIGSVGGVKAGMMFLSYAKIISNSNYAIIVRKKFYTSTIKDWVMAVKSGNMSVTLVHRTFDIAILTMDVTGVLLLPVGVSNIFRDFLSE